jgi:hypothetical protein
MHVRTLVSMVAAVCLAHVQAFAAEGAGSVAESMISKRPPVPVAKPATPIADTTKVIADGEGKPGEAVVPGARAPRGGPLPHTGTERASNAPECVWTGRRVVSLLTKDDVDAANQFTRFYSMFGCPAPHIGTALGCYVAWDGQATHEEKLEACWSDPNGKRPAPASTADAAREPGKDAAKPGEDKPPAKN